MVGVYSTKYKAEVFETLCSLCYLCLGGVVRFLVVVVVVGLVVGRRKKRDKG